jgi:hypothetical protein
MGNDPTLANDKLRLAVFILVVAFLSVLIVRMFNF